MSTAPLQFLLMTFASWVNRRQFTMIDYLKEGNHVLRQQLGGGRLRFTFGGGEVQSYVSPDR